jgi:hypothetical protein
MPPAVSPFALRTGFSLPESGGRFLRLFFLAGWKNADDPLC